MIKKLRGFICIMLIVCMCCACNSSTSETVTETEYKKETVYKTETMEVNETANKPLLPILEKIKDEGLINMSAVYGDVSDTYSMETIEKLIPGDMDKYYSSGYDMGRSITLVYSPVERSEEGHLLISLLNSNMDAEIECMMCANVDPNDQGMSVFENGIQIDYNNSDQPCFLLPVNKEPGLHSFEFVTFEGEDFKSNVVVYSCIIYKVEDVSVDCDEIIENDGRYCLCRKNISNFDTNQDYYGIYDMDLNEWAVEYMPLPIGEYSNPVFLKHGNGMFSYGYGEIALASITSERCFFSADLGTYFTMKVAGESSEIRFYDGYAFVLKYIHENVAHPYYVLYKLNSYGELEEINITDYYSGITAEECSWHSRFVNPKHDNKIFAVKFSANNQDNLFVYLYDENRAVIIDDASYVDRIYRHSITGFDNHDTCISYNDNKIIFEKLKGDDGEYYWAQFDANGDLAMPAERW